MNRKHLVSDLVAGLTTGIADIPDAMASAVLAGCGIILLTKFQPCRDDDIACAWDPTGAVPVLCS